MSGMPQVQGSVLVMQGDIPIVDVTAVDCTPWTRFQIASVSKQFTAAAVLRLAERGVLRVDDRIGRWIDACPPSWRDITLHHLLTHTSGLGHWRDYPMIDPTRRLEPAELRQTFQWVPPFFAPGTGWRYSSPGYVLLAHVVQRATDEPYRDWLSREIFAPLGMQQTFVGSPGEREQVARGSGRDGSPVPSFELDVLGMGAGDVWSTTGDLIAWIDSLRAGRLLSEPYRTLMLSEQAPTGGDSDASGYGYGWFIGSFSGQPWFHHSGDNPGFCAFDACLPESDLRIVVLSNSEALDPAMISQLLVAVLQ
ncbi:MAG TPA: serine hydrolase domain-containing protein [Kineosporiaceae bacterium]|nr:serine hydrolase domain-containing protein [Kineosporiaceae bacterium]